MKENDLTPEEVAACLRDIALSLDSDDGDNEAVEYAAKCLEWASTRICPPKNAKIAIVK